jgi:hypothetical protein
LTAAAAASTLQCSCKHKSSSNTHNMVGASVRPATLPCVPRQQSGMLSANQQQQSLLATSVTTPQHTLLTSLPQMTYCGSDALAATPMYCCCNSHAPRTFTMILTTTYVAANGPKNCVGSSTSAVNATAGPAFRPAPHGSRHAAHLAACLVACMALQVAAT